MPTYDDQNEVDIFLDELEREVPKKQCFQVLDWALHATPARWWGAHKGRFHDWCKCRRMMRTHFKNLKM